MAAIDRIIFEDDFPEDFFEIPKKIYQDMNFIPEENPDEVKALFNLKKEDHKIIIYTDHQNIRLVGIFPEHDSCAYFAFWETANHIDTNSVAFNLLEKDAKAENKKKIVGPMHFNTFHRYRLRLGGMPSWKMFDREPVNPFYYPNLLQKLKYDISLTYESRYIPPSAIEKIYEKQQKFLNSIQNIPFKILPLNPETWKEHETEIFELAKEIFSRNPGYKKVDPAEFKLLYNQEYAEKLCPNSASLFLDGKKPIAFMLCLPNYKNLRKAHNEKICFKTDFQNLKKPTLLAKTSGVHPDYRQMNLMTYSGAFVMRSFKKLYKDVIFCLMKTDNYSRHFTDGIPHEKAHYALYEKRLGQ